MRTILSLALVGAIASGVALADGKKAPKAKSMSVSGSVVSVDAAGGKLSVKDKKGVQTDFTVGADAKVMKGKTAGTLADVMVDDSVTVSYKKEGDVITVTKVVIKPAKKAKAAAKK